MLDPSAPLWILKLGNAVPEVIADHGDFEDWIRAGLGLAPDQVRVAAIHAGEPLPEPGALGAVVMTGSSAMVTERPDWSERTAAWLPTVVAAGTPVLGICYGHQLLAHSLGGVVGDNPRGREVGSVGVTLTQASDDPLLGALPNSLRVQATHLQSVLALPRQARLLGANGADPHHVLRMGPRTWGVQFHPEFDAAVMRGYLEARRAVLEAEGRDTDALLRRVVDSQHGSALLRRFGEIVRQSG